MAVPNHLKIVEQVNTAYPHLLKSNTHAACGEFLQRLVAALPAGERWGLLSKSGSENGVTFPNGVKTSVDYVAVPQGDRVDVIMASAGAAEGYVGSPCWVPAHESEWRPSNTWIDISAWPIYDSGTPPDAGGVSDMRLAFGWFCWMTAIAEWPSEAKANLDWILPSVGPSVFRVMLAVEGQSHGTPDPWRDAGVFLANDWDNRFKKMLDVAGGVGVQLHCTVYGGRNQTPTEDDRRRFHDRIVAAAAGRWSAIRSFEMMNEYKVNKWTAAEVRAAGRDLRSKLPPGFLLSLSSPAAAHGELGSMPTNEQMEASADELYAGDDHAGANEMTIHTMRGVDPTTPEGKWANPGAYNFLYPTLPKINNEPPGPGSSAGGETSDADLVARDCENTKAAGWPLYVGHAEWCPWNGHLPPEYYNGYREIRNVWDLPHMPECAAAMKAIAGDESAAPLPPAAPPSGLASGAALAPDATLESPDGRFRCHNQPDGNLVLSVVGGAAYWASNTPTAADAAGNLNMQADGNLVLYRADGTPAWASRTTTPGATAQLQDDGNLVVYDPAGTPLWASGPPPPVS